MKRHTILRVAFVATLAMLTGGVVGGTAAADPAPGAFRVIAAGTTLDFDGDMNYGISNPNGQGFADAPNSGLICTLGAVGTDSAGRKIGITAGHCNPGTAKDDTKPKIPGVTRGQEVLDNSHPVWGRREVKWNADHGLAPANPIGWIRWVDADVCDANDPWDPVHVLSGIGGCTVGVMTDPDSTTDYMVIEFAPDVQLSSQVRDIQGNPLFKINSLHKNSAGVLTTPAPLDWVENYGANSDYFDVSGHEDGRAYGRVTLVWSGLFRSFAEAMGGDSGGPVVMRGTGKWTGINFGSTLDIPKYVSTSAMNILNDLNPRGITGSGFMITNN